MKRRQQPLTRLALTGLRVAPAQVCGGVRLVPLLREQVRGDLRLWQRRYGDDAAAVGLDHRPVGEGLSYLSYVPHGLVLRFSDDGEPVAAWGSQLHDAARPAARPPSARERRRDEGDLLADGPFRVRGLHRMIKREGRDQLRLLPLHIAMEGFLELCFTGPELRWPEYAERALRFGLSPRIEHGASGRAIAGLDRALRLFEIHEGQCGVLLYVMDALAAAFVTPHPDDYRALHRTLLLDFFGTELLEFARLPYRVPEIALPPRADGAPTLSDLEAALARCKQEWRDLHKLLSDRLIEREVQAVGLYQAGPFLLQRFWTRIDLDSENHLGEAIVRDDGTLEYLKTYRLSFKQAERAHLLQALQAHHFHLEATARALGTSRERLILRVVKAGFGALFKPEVVRAAYAALHPTRR